MSDTVQAVWAGPFDAELPDGTTVVLGDTYEIPKAQASSAHWQPVKQSSPKAGRKADS